jgi:undecaprenyl diphosphate synthase
MSANPESQTAEPRLPRHVAVIMDGNGRWARQRALPRQAGHRSGIKPVRMAVERCVEKGIAALTLFAFSSENWDRPVDEVHGLMSLFVEALEREVDELHRNGVKLRFIGDREVLGAQLRDATLAAEHRTGVNENLELVVAVAYGGRWDLTQAARKLAVEAADGRLDPNDIDESMLANALSTADLPSVDLLIRTGGEKRISNFLLWDIAYSEVYFSDVLWPDFSAAEFDRTLEFYAQRQRRFGRTGDQIGAVRC